MKRRLACLLAIAFAAAFSSYGGVAQANNCLSTYTNSPVMVGASHQIALGGGINCSGTWTSQQFQSGLYADSILVLASDIYTYFEGPPWETFSYFVVCPLGGVHNYQTYFRYRVNWVPGGWGSWHDPGAAGATGPFYGACA